MAKRTANAVWQGTIKEGQGTMKLGSGAFEGQYSFASRFEEGTGTNPEELIAAAHSGCFSMALSAGLGRAGYKPKRINTTATVHLNKVDDAFRITGIDLNTEAEVPEITDEAFLEQATAAKNNCPVSRALSGTEIKLTARLVNTAAG